MDSDCQSENAAIELHDSEIVAINRDGTTLVLDLKAFVHRSHGVPGFDHGTEWLQSAALTLVNGRWLDPEPESWHPIYDGIVIIGDRVIDNLIA